MTRASLRRIALPALFAALLVASGVACSSDEDGSSEDTGQDLERFLEGLLLKEEDLPPGFTRGGLNISANERLAESAADPQAELARLEALGRQLGVEVTFAPQDNLAPEFPVGGGIENSISLYSTPEGASQAMNEGVESARQADWASIHPGLTEVTMQELPRPVGDESVWFRISGLDESGQRSIDDQVVYRIGAARIFLRVVSVFDPAAPPEVFADDVARWAEIVAGRTREALASG